MTIPSSFDPVDLFAGGESGAYYLASELSQLRNAADGSGATPNVGGTIGYLADLSGNAAKGITVTVSGTIMTLDVANGTGAVTVL